MDLSLLLGLLLAAEPSAEKVEPLEKDDFIKAEVAKLQGEWEVVSIVDDGMPRSDDAWKAVRRPIDGTSFVLARKGDEKQTLKGKYTLDPTKGVKHIDVTLFTKGKANEAMAQGIYRLDGDTQTACMG